MVQEGWSGDKDRWLGTYGTQACELYLAIVRLNSIKYISSNNDIERNVNDIRLTGPRTSQILPIWSRWNGKDFLPSILASSPLKIGRRESSSA